MGRGRSHHSLAFAKVAEARKVGSVAKYFFNVVEDNHAVDVIGADYPDAEVARIEAVRFIADLLKREPARVWKGSELRVEATDAWGTVLFTLIIAGVDAEALQRHVRLDQ